MIKRNLAFIITLMLIFSSTITAISGSNYLLNDENCFLIISEDKNIQMSDDLYLLFVGRIDNLSINETNYSFDCINVRTFGWYYNEGLPIFVYGHFRSNNRFGLSAHNKSWELGFTHYYTMDIYRFSFENWNFSGIIKPSYIIGVFYKSIDNNSNFFNKEILKNNEIKCDDETKILNYSNVHIDFFIGTISDLKIEDNIIRFNSTNIFNAYYDKDIIHLHWLRFGMRRLRYKNSFGYGGDAIQFKGILKPNFICGFFVHKY